MTEYSVPSMLILRNTPCELVVPKTLSIVACLGDLLRAWIASSRWIA